MDEVVRQAMSKWPDVPHVYGWLVFDRRGQWRVRDEYAQQHGLSGDPVRHEALAAFIERNYLRDADGAWFFQNGPQRVFVTLAYAPWVARLHAGRFTTSSGRGFEVQECFVDEQGNVLLAGKVEGEPPGSGVQAALLHDHDLEAFSGACTWHGQACGASLGVFHHGDVDIEIEPIVSDEVARRFRFVREPVKR